MKRILHIVAMGLIALASTSAFSQDRDLGARRVILDDGASGLLTIEYAGPGNATFTVPAGGGMTVANGSTLSATLRWDGTAWVENSSLLAGPAGTLSSTGVLSTTSALQATGEATFAGDIAPTTLRVKSTDGIGWDGFAGFGGAAATVVAGQFASRASIGAHNAALNAWAPLYINEGGNVRIGGTAVPASTLDVTGSFATSGAVTLGDGNDNINLNAGTGTFALTSSGLNIAAGNITLSGTVDGVDISTADAANVKLTGAQAIAGAKTFDDPVTIGDIMVLGEYTHATLTADNTAIASLPTSFLRIQSDVPVAADRTFTLPNGSTNGQLLLIMQDNASGYSQLESSGNVNLRNNDSMEFTALNTIMLVWNDNWWVEVSRNED